MSHCLFLEVMQLFSIKYTFNFSVLHYVLVFGSSVDHFSIRKQNVTVTSGRDNKRFSLLPLDETFEMKPLFEVTVENNPPPLLCWCSRSLVEAQACGGERVDSGAVLGSAFPA